MRLEAVGYWFNDAAPSLLPRPQRLIGRWDPARRARVVAYLDAAPVFETYRGTSWCRLCGARGRGMGWRDRFDGRFVWPEGLSHYVAVHGVRLPPAFVRRAQRDPERLAVERPARREGLVDETAWRAWAIAAGAVPDVGPPWTPPPTRTRAAIEDRIDFAGEVVLWRADRREAVVHVPDGRLAVVGPRGVRAIVAGWDAWPRLTRSRPPPRRRAAR